MNKEIDLGKTLLARLQAQLKHATLLELQIKGLNHDPDWRHEVTQLTTLTNKLSSCLIEMEKPRVITNSNAHLLALWQFMSTTRAANKAERTFITRDFIQHCLKHNLALPVIGPKV